MYGSFQRSSLCGFLGLIAALFFTGLYGPPQNGWCFLTVVVVLTAIFGVGFSVLAGRYDAKLTQRIATPTASSWDVVLNDVKLGSVTDAEYAEIQQRVFRDGRVAGEQFLNLLHVALRAAGRFVLLIPFLFFWAAIALFLFSPDSVSTVVQVLQKGDPVMLAKTTEAFLRLVFTVMAMAMLITSVCGLDFGFRDCYSEGINRRLRRHFKTHATGNMHLTRQQEACACSNG
jgi:hypothetical protein